MDVIDRQEIETVFTANMKQLETAMIRYGNAMEAAAARQDRAFRQSNANITRDANRLNQNLRNAVAVGALAVAGKEVIDYEATWRNLSNTLNLYEKTIGPAEAATKRLNAVAVDASVKIGELGNLTGAAARAVGANKGAFEDAGEAVFDFAELTSKAAQISNNGSAAVSGALTQLSQAIASPRVQLGEFNSIIEGTPRLAQAFADGIGKANGSIFQLRQLIIAGDVSGTDLISGLISQAGVLRAEFDGLETGAAEALNRFENRVAEFIGTNQTAIDAQQGLAAAIDFVANNLDTLTDAIVIGGAALGGFLGASALASITSGLGGVTKGLKGTAAAMALLNGVSKIFGGPWVIGITAVAGALAFLALRGDDVTASMKKLEGTLEDYRRVGGRIQSDTQKMVTLQGELDAAIAAQQTTVVATKNAEIAAIQQRISANRDLLKVYGDLATKELAQVQQNVARATQTTFADNINLLSPEARAKSALGARAAAVVQSDGVSPIGQPEEYAARQKEAFLQLLDEEIARNNQLREQGKTLNEEQLAAYQIRADYLQLLDRERELTEQVKQVDPAERFRAFLSSRPGAAGAPAGGDAAAGDDAAKDDALSAIEEIRAAYQATFDTEIEGVERVYRARIEAINKSKASDQEKLLASIEAEEILSAEIGKIKAEQDAEDADYAEERAKRVKDQTDSEVQLLDEILYARDAAQGRTLALIEREYAARRAEAEAEFEDAERRAIALAALEEEKEKVIADVRKRALDDARDFTERDVIQSEVNSIRDEAQARIDAINAAYGGEIEAHQEAQDAIAAIIREANDEIVRLGQDRLIGYVDNVGSMFGSIASVIEDFGGKQSGAYKAIIAIERAFTFAKLSLGIAQGIGEAIKIGFPQNIPIIAGVTAQGAQALSLLAPKGGGFQKGGHTGYGADTDVRGFVHANEYVQPAPVVSYYGVDIMKALQFRRIPKHLLQGYQRGGYVGVAPPAVMRTADRITSAATAAATSIRNTSNVVNIQQGDVILNGGGGSDVAAQLRAELRQSEARIAAQVLPAVANDIRRGGGDVTDALQSAYALARRGG
ncbi:MAG: hypothetical protein C0421_05675 [Hyphomonas sp.]|uniref:tape measure protein n=1 Tax=Hyphomonas sp. TaxID=87 RepID=UPI0025B82291|nr:tape measure protein [Hyphomonas sp.]MBA4338316.1 hypothetical protein [Hyphomonas sp.]